MTSRTGAVLPIRRPPRCFAVITEAPKLGPHLAAMAAALAARLGRRPARCSVKAKTNEGMGFIGRGEGLAVIAVAMLEAR